MTRVLVVDDSEDTVLLYVETLNAAGFEATGSADPNEALNEAIAHPPDIVVTDIAMPAMDGSELGHLLRSYAPTRDVRLIAVSAHAFDFRRRAMPPGGWDACLRKPLEPEILVATVRAVAAAGKREKVDRSGPTDAGDPPPTPRNGSD